VDGDTTERVSLIACCGAWYKGAYGGWVGLVLKGLCKQEYEAHYIQSNKTVPEPEMVVGLVGPPQFQGG
jgi:hypothetical protein